MEATPGRNTSTQHPTVMELQRGQAVALRDGDVSSAVAYRLAVFLKIEEAQSAALNPAA